MSILDDLPTASMVKAPPGYRARQRCALPGATLNELDAMVEEAGGRRINANLPEPRGLRPGRLLRRAVDASYYLIPDDAFDD